jgi:Xaa-Pro aminopeptidase
METLQPTLKRGRDVWDPIGMPESEFRARVDRIAKEMRKRRMKVLLLYGIGQNDYACPCYVTNYLTKMPQGAVAVITDKGEIALICEGFARDAALIKDTTWVKEIRSSEALSRTCVQYLKEKRLIPSTIGFAGLRQHMPYREFEILSEATRRCRIVEAEHIVNRMQMIKSGREIDQVRRSARLVARLFDSLARVSFPTFSERAVEALLYRLGYLEGAEDVRILIARPRGERPGEKNETLRPPEDITISLGDPVVVHLGIEFERYWAEGTRTYRAEGASLAESTPEGVRSLYGRITKGLVPGKTASGFYREALAKIKRSRMPFVTDYGLGGGIGLSCQEHPLLSADDDTVLKEGMTLSLSLAVTVPETGLTMLGDTVHLSGKEPEILTVLLP